MLPFLGADLVKRVIQLSSNGRSGHDGHLVSEMLQHLEEDLLDLIADAFLPLHSDEL